jgi:hypothetical protein
MVVPSFHQQAFARNFPYRTKYCFRHDMLAARMICAGRTTDDVHDRDRDRAAGLGEHLCREVHEPTRRLDLLGPLLESLTGKRQSFRESDPDKSKRMVARGDTVIVAENDSNGSKATV